LSNKLAIIFIEGNVKLVVDIDYKGHCTCRSSCIPKPMFLLTPVRPLTLPHSVARCMLLSMEQNEIVLRAFSDVDGASDISLFAAVAKATKRMELSLLFALCREAETVNKVTG